MSRLKQLKDYRRHLNESYKKLLSTSIDYRFEDESKNDMAAFKAMKVLEKINKVRYLDREMIL